MDNHYIDGATRYQKGTFDIRSCSPCFAECILKRSTSFAKYQKKKGPSIDRIERIFRSRRFIKRVTVHQLEM